LNLAPHITGNYVMLLASDDFILEKDSIMKNLRILMESGADGIYSDLIIVNKAGIATKAKGKVFFSIKRLIISGGSNPIPDIFFLKKKIFDAYVVPNHLIRNGPYYFSIQNGKIRAPFLKYSPEPWYAYRVYEENYVQSPIGRFVTYNGKMRTIKDFFLNGFVISPSFFTLNYRVYAYSLVLYDNLPRIIERIFRIKKSSLESSLKQLKKIIILNQKGIYKHFKDKEDPTYLYLGRIAESVDDYLYWEKTRKIRRQIFVNEESASKIPVYEGKDIRIFYKEHVISRKNKIIHEIFQKDYNIIVCDTKKTRRKVEKLLDLINYLTPIIVNR
ncbi:MAG: hypothetical protein ACTSRW_14925, partial [Candidatus Helarchaeota archaeon]